MRKNEELFISFITNDNRTLPIKKITSLPLKEEAVIKRSIEFYNDPEPCMIHRSAVMNRIFAEIEEYFKVLLAEGKSELQWNELPENIISALQCNDRISTVRFRIGNR